MKYRLTDETRVVNGRTLHRIEKLEGGEKGGFIETEQNLSQTGAAWVHPDGFAFENARVVEDGQVYGRVYGNAAIRGNAEIYGEAFGSCVIGDHVKIHGKAGGNAAVFGSDVVEQDKTIM